MAEKNVQAQQVQVKRQVTPFPLICKEWAKVIDGESNLTTLSNVYAVLIEVDETRFPIRYNHETRSYARISEQVIVNELLTISNLLFADSLFPEAKDMALTPKKAKEVVEHWKCSCLNIKRNIKDICFLSDECDTFYRIPFDPVELDDYSKLPYFSDIKKRLSNFQAFCAWVWSLFENNKDRRQYIWLCGEGHSGKSQITETIAKLMGGSVTTSNPKVCKRDNWTHSLVDKRLCILTEAHPEFPASEMFKSITGDDRHRVNEKYMVPYDATINTKFIFVSNDDLQIGSDRAAMSRAIFCRLQPYDRDPVPPEEYQAQLLAEMPGFLGYCRYIYRSIAKHGNIKADMSEVMDLAEEREIKFELAFDQHFIKKEGSRVSRHHAQTVLRAVGIDGIEYGKFKQWLKSKHGVDIKNIRSEGEKTWCFFGIELREVTTYGRRQKENGVFMPPVEKMRY